jgi:hypothetical protein
MNLLFTYPTTKTSGRNVVDPLGGCVSYENKSFTPDEQCFGPVEANNSAGSCIAFEVRPAL